MFILFFCRFETYIFWLQKYKNITLAAVKKRSMFTVLETSTLTF